MATFASNDENLLFGELCNTQKTDRLSSSIQKTAKHMMTRMMWGNKTFQM